MMHKIIGIWEQFIAKKYTDQVKVEMPSSDQFSRHQVHIGTTKDGMSETSRKGAD